MTRLASSCVIVTAACWLSVACGQPAPEVVQSETVVPVTTEPATVGTIRAVIHATGTVAPAPGADLLVVAPEAARIAEMPKAEGDRVRRGDVLVRFEIPTLNADAESKRAEVTRAAILVDTAKAALTRARDLVERGVAARKDVEDATRQLADAEAAFEQARAARGAADAVAGRTTVRATFDGVVAKRTHNPGDQVEPTASDPVMRVIDPRRLEVSAMIPVGDVSRIKVGAEAHLVDAAGEGLATLKVVSTPAAIDPGTASAPVRLAFSGAGSYPVGTPVQIEVNAEEHANVVLVPAVAVVREGEEVAVFVTDGKTAHRQPIEMGLADKAHVEVRSGVKAGDVVITHGQNGLPDGATVTVAPAK